MEWLSINRGTLKRLRRQGVLVPVAYHQRTYWYDAADVRSAAAAIREPDHLDKISSRAFIALSTAKRCERKLDVLLELQGVAPLERVDLFALYRFAHERCHRGFKGTTPAEILQWARHLVGVTSEGLQAIAIEYGSERPWLVFSSVAENLLEHVPESSLHKMAREVLVLARDRFRQEAYIFCRTRYTHAVARRLVPDARYDHVNDTILSLLL